MFFDSILKLPVLSRIDRRVNFEPEEGEQHEKIIIIFICRGRHIDYLFSFPGNAARAGQRL